MTRNLLEAEWVSKWVARKVLRRVQYHLAAWNDDSACLLLDPLILELTRHYGGRAMVRHGIAVFTLFTVAGTPAVGEPR